MSKKTLIHNLYHIIKSELILDITIKPKTIKLLEENVYKLKQRFLSYNTKNANH